MSVVQVRKEHSFDTKKCIDYLRTQVPELFKDCSNQQKIEIVQFNHGQSNPSFLIKQGGVEFVLKKKPPGKLLKGAHAIEREFRIQKALHSQNFPVPFPFHLCEDSEIIGTPFYIMQYMKGRIFLDGNLVELNPDDREECYKEAMSVLARLHSFSPQDLGLTDYGPKSNKNYYLRQINTWSMAYRATETDKIEDMDYLIDWLPKNIPENNELINKVTIVHGDYRFDNVMFHPTENKIIAVLDWELSTLGNPLADLGLFSMMYHVSPNFYLPGLGFFDKEMSGIPTEFKNRDNYLDYTNSSRDAINEKDWSFILAVNFFKNVGIAQGVYKRGLMGTASSTRGAHFLPIVKYCAKLCRQISQQEYQYIIRAKEQSFLQYSDHFKKIRSDLIYFMERHIFGVQRQINKKLGYGPQRFKFVSQEIEDLKEKAKKAGLFNLFLPSISGLTNVEYAHLCEIMGRSIIAPEIFNCGAPDTGNMETLHLYGTKQQKDQWLKPLLAGEIRSMFGMTEPAVASSDATNMITKIVKTEDGKSYKINGRKWWSSGAGDPRCKIAIVMGITPDPNKAKHQQHSMILVPMETSGVKIIRSLTVFGHDDAPVGHMEVLFDNVIVPAENMLLGEGRGFEIAQGRLGPGRVHHCMRSIGMAEKALELLVDRAAKRVTFGAQVLTRQKIQCDIAECRMEIEQARLLTLQCADAIDKKGAKAARKEIAMIKIVVPNMACRVVDRAIQVHGATGVSGDSILSYLYSGLRTLRIADGPDEVHMMTVAKMEIESLLSHMRRPKL